MTTPEMPRDLRPIPKAPAGFRWEYRGRYWQPPLGVLVAFHWKGTKDWHIIVPDEDASDLGLLGTHWVELVPEVDWQARAESLEAALNMFKATAREALIHWDADRDVKVGKLLRAMSGYLPGYRADIDAAHKALGESGVGR